MKTKNQKIQNILKSLTLSVNGRKGTSGEQKSILQGGEFSGSFNSFPDKGRLGGVFPLPPHGGGTFCEAKGGGVGVGGLRSKKAFTLVELIIVITILAILATLAFMSFQGYMKDSRDAVRVSDLTNVSKGLTIFFTKAGVYPDTENGITLTASGIPIGYQGYLGQSVVRAINMNQVPLDPVDQTRYIYSTSAGKTKFQLMGYTENSNLVSLLPQSYAIDYSERGLAFQGDELGVVLNNDNSLPTSTVETASGTSNFKVLFDKTTKTEGSGNLIFSQIYNMREDLINKKELASLDNTLVGYWDMETTIQSGSTLLLKDWSKYGNHGTCYNRFTEVSCGIVGNGPQFVNGEGKTGKSMSFDGVDDWINVPKDNYLLLPTNDITVLSVFKVIKENTNPISIINTSIDGYAGFRFGPGGSSASSNINILYGKSSGYFSGDIGGNKSTDGTIHTLITRFVLNNKVEMFMDGKYLGLLNVSGKGNDVSLNKSQSFLIGQMGYVSFLNGTIDELRVYNRALSDSEIKALYSATK